MTLTANTPITAAKGPNGFVYIANTNSTDKVVRYDLTAASPATDVGGLAAPTAAPTQANVSGYDYTGAGGQDELWGTWQVYYRYWSEDGDGIRFYTNLSPVLECTVDSTDSQYQLDFSCGAIGSADGIQLWRSTHGQAEVVYLDDEMTDTEYTAASGTFESTNTDADLMASEAMRILSSDGYPNANRFTPPEEYLGVVVAHQDRMWYAVTEEDTTEDYEERNKIYFSELLEPESVPVSNALQMPEDNDRLVGLMPLFGRLYALKERSIWAIETSGDPRRHAEAVPVAARGCLNQRCWCTAGTAAFLLDQHGAYLFNGTQVQDIGDVIQDVFRQDVNWEDTTWFHVGNDASDTTVRFFVVTDSGPYPKTALAFNYQDQNWTVEEYPVPIACSCQAKIRGKDRLIAGTYNHAILLNEGSLDGFWPQAEWYAEEVASRYTQTITGTITSRNLLSITDSAADFDFTEWLAGPEECGAPLTVVASDGSTQTRKIASIDATNKQIRIATPWATLPDVGDTYLIGGIPWEVKIGSYRFLEGEWESPRRFRMRFKPMDTGSAALKVYYDGSETAQSHSITWENDDGISVEADSDNVTVDLTHTPGFAQYAFGGSLDGHIPPEARCVDFDLSGVAGGEVVEIYEVELDGVE